MGRNFSPEGAEAPLDPLGGRRDFFPKSTVDITVWTTLWIMCKSPFPEGVRWGDGDVMKR